MEKSPTGTSNEEVAAESAERIAETFSSLPPGYEQFLSEVAKITEILLRALSSQTESRLNGYLKTAPKGTLADKRALASRVNRDLRELGLAIRCPVTGGESILLADARDVHDEEGGRFRIEHRDDSGRKYRTAISSDELNLQLVPSNAYRGGRKADLQGGTLHRQLSQSRTLNRIQMPSKRGLDLHPVFRQRWRPRKLHSHHRRP